MLGSLAVDSLSFWKWAVDLSIMENGHCDDDERARGNVEEEGKPEKAADCEADGSDRHPSTSTPEQGAERHNKEPVADL